MSCIGFVCTCGDSTDEHADHHEDCTCLECCQEREALKDREFDERVALGYV